MFSCIGNAPTSVGREGPACQGGQWMKPPVSKEPKGGFRRTTTRCGASGCRAVLRGDDRCEKRARLSSLARLRRASQPRPRIQPRLASRPRTRSLSARRRSGISMGSVRAFGTPAQRVYVRTLKQASAAALDRRSSKQTNNRRFGRSRHHTSAAASCIASSARMP